MIWKLGPDIFQTLHFTYEERSRRLSEAFTTTWTFSSVQARGGGCGERAEGSTKYKYSAAESTVFLCIAHPHQCLFLLPGAVEFPSLSKLTSSSVSSTCLSPLFLRYFYSSPFTSAASQKHQHNYSLFVNLLDIILLYSLMGSLGHFLEILLGRAGKFMENMWSIWLNHLHSHITISQHLWKFQEMSKIHCISESSFMDVKVLKFAHCVIK